MTDTLYSISTSLPFCICLCWWVILLLRRDAVSTPAHRYLSLFALVSTVLYFCHAAFFSGEESSVLRCIYYVCHLGVFPMFWLYIRTLTEPVRLKWRSAWVMIPSVLALAVLVALLALGLSPDLMEIPVRIVFLLQLVLVCVLVIRRLTAFDRKVQNFYVDTEHKSLRELRSLFFLLVPVTILSAVGGALGRHVFLDSPLIVAPSLLFSALLFGLFHVGFLLEYTAAEMAAGGTEAPAPEEPEEDESGQQALLQQVEALMGSRRIYLTPGLKISDVAEALDTNRTYISACINRQTGMSFSDYVNGFRVRYAQELMSKKDPELTLAQIAVKSGFSGDTSFFRNFKKITGQTPSEWQNSR